VDENTRPGILHKRLCPFVQGPTRLARQRDGAIIEGFAIALKRMLVPAEVALCVGMQLNGQIQLNILDSKMISFSIIDEVTNKHDRNMPRLINRYALQATYVSRRVLNSIV
jgi:hypothetical protein